LLVLCGKTLEHSKMEVLEEEELKYMREEQKHFQKMREDEIAEAQKLEAIELRKKQEIERRKQQHKVKKLEKIAAHKKFTCRQAAKKFFSPLTSHALVSLQERGGMIVDFEEKMHKDLVPWLFEKTHEFLIDDDLHDNNGDKLLGDVMRIEEKCHIFMIEKEHKRLENQRIAAEEALQQKLHEKENRKLERERKRKEEEMRKLKEDIRVKFIATSEPTEGILYQDLASPNADLASKGIVGAVGGPFMQIAIVLSVISQTEEDCEEWFNKKNVAQFLITYVITAMKSENLTILLGRHIEVFMEETDQTMEDITKLTTNKAKAFRDMMKDRENGMLNATFRFFDKVCKTAGIAQEVFEMVHDVLADILTRKPKAKEGVETKQDQFLKRVKILSAPEDGKEELDNCKAIVKIRIPMVEKKDEDGSDEEEEDKEEGEGEGEQNKKPKEIKFVEAPIEDKVQLVNPRGTDYNIMVLHQAGARLFRKEILSGLMKLMPTFEELDVDKILPLTDALSDKLEDIWTATYDCPVFDFEIN
jgi:hypothetical protein